MGDSRNDTDAGRLPAEEEFDLLSDADTRTWLALSEGSFDFWDNEEDAIYDDL